MVSFHIPSHIVYNPTTRHHLVDQSTYETRNVRAAFNCYVFLSRAEKFIFSIFTKSHNAVRFVWDTKRRNGKLHNVQIKFKANQSSLSRTVTTNDTPLVIFTILKKQTTKIYTPSVFIAQTSLLRRSVCTKNLRQYFPVQTSHSVNKSLIK